MWRIKRALSILFTVALALQAIAGSAAAAILYVDDDGSGNYTTIQDAVDDAASGDTIIVNPGTYTEEITISVPDLVLASSSQYNAVIRSTENAFNLKANNITIKSFNIIGTGSAGYYGIADSSPSCTIQNNKISNFYIGIGVSNVDGGGGGSIINNDIFDCGDGVLLFSSSVNEISGNRISNCETGIDIIDSYGTRFYNNNFNNTRNVQSAADSHWNTTKKSGKNIIGGPYIGGNYWATPAGDGFSQTHLDANGDGFAEVPYEMNEVNIDSLPLVTPRTEPGPILPAANFKANITQGPAPLVVQFTDISQNATSRNWDFDNDGKVDSTAESEIHVYTDPRTYTVNLTAINVNGTTSKTAVITVLEKGNDVLPTADFSTNVSSGIAPLSVLFTDLSQNATSRSWEVNSDGIEDSSEASFTYIYPSAGTYTAKLTAINANGTYTKTMIIAVEEKSSGGSSGGSSSGGSSSGGSSGGGGGSPEPAKNVEVKELSQVFITNGKAVKFDFTKNATCVVYIGFDAIKNVGKTTTIVEQLKNKSALVSELPSGEVYKSFNVWVGNSGYATSKNIENPVISFKVEKAWLQDQKIDKSSITLNSYEEKVWVQLPASLSGEDEKYLYFTAKVPGYASFAITGKSTLQVQDENSQIPAENRSAGAFSSEDNGTEGAEPDESSRNGSTLLSVGIVIGALVVAGVVLKSMKK
ncbi:PGF-pre-PGF domain-containing protein [Methanosarcina sp. DH2]|uniref:PGF-pre-PGF domain-containing protein n=1 Tax=Methanosarcina sp. DH2 TaxID=2605639 RepID=UPI001E3600BF|nr:PGF-pre-PGF domain-containing protein [Methanosarcina sp. DH2]